MFLPKFLAFPCVMSFFLQGVVAGEFSSGTGTRADPFYYDFIDDDTGEGWGVCRFQHNSSSSIRLDVNGQGVLPPFPPASYPPPQVGESDQTKLDFEQFELYHTNTDDLIGFNTQINYNGSHTEVIHESIRTYSQAGPVTVASDLKSKSGAAVSFPNGLDPDIYLFQHKGVDTSMVADVQRIDGAVFAWGFLEDAIPGSEDFVDDCSCLAYFDHNGGNGLGYWSFQLSRALNGVVAIAHDQEGDFGGGSAPDAVGTTINLPEVDIYSLNGLDTDFLFGIEDFGYVETFIRQHPLPISFQVSPWSPSYIVKEILGSLV